MTSFSDQAGRHGGGAASSAHASPGPENARGPRRDIAIALGHNRDGGDLPRVVASGKGAIARQILQIAFDRGIKVREDADLAEVLAAVEVDSEIPLAAFAAVAEILSYVYRAQGASPEYQAQGVSPATGEFARSPLPPIGESP